MHSLSFVKCSSHFSPKSTVNPFWIWTFNPEWSHTAHRHLTIKVDNGSVFCCAVVHRERWRVRWCGGLLRSASEANGILSWGDRLQVKRLRWFSCSTPEIEAWRSCGHSIMQQSNYQSLVPSLHEWTDGLWGCWRWPLPPHHSLMSIVSFVVVLRSHIR